MKDTIDGINEKAWDRAMAGPRRRVKTPALTHASPMWDVPGRSVVVAYCGQTLYARDITPDPTCETCAARKAARDAAEV